MILRILGVMTGTSCDGLDACCIEATPNEWRVLWKASQTYPAQLARRVLQIQKPGTVTDLQSLLGLEQDFSEWVGKSIRSMLRKHPHALPDLLSIHGQTIAHFPKLKKSAPRSGTTLQLLNPAWIAQQAELSVVSHFRQGDLAAQGQGAPLAPFFHKSVLLARLGKQAEGVAIHNLGGISNLTYLGPGQQILAWDTGPANLWIDEATAKYSGGKLLYDKNGLLARQGEPDHIAIQKILSRPYFKLKPPKSTGRDDFAWKIFASSTSSRGKDLIATATLLTARSIANDYQQWILKKHLPLNCIYFSGGGAQNETLLKWIQALLPQVKINTTQELGLDPQFVEAEAFAILGLASLCGLTLGGRWTGIMSDFAPPGWITPGHNWKKVISTLYLLNQNQPKYL